MLGVLRVSKWNHKICKEKVIEMAGTQAFLYLRFIVVNQRLSGSFQDSHDAVFIFCESKCELYPEMA